MDHARIYAGYTAATLLLLNRVMLVIVVMGGREETWCQISPVG